MLASLPWASGDKSPEASEIRLRRVKFSLRRVKFSLRRVKSGLRPGDE